MYSCVTNTDACSAGIIEAVLADNKRPLTDEEAEVLRRRLSVHYRDQVITVSDFCKALQQWSSVAGKFISEMMELGSRRSHEGQPDPEPFDASRLFMAASKSSLLGRLLYDRETLRTTKCPTHNGVWCGCFIDCPCQGTGWLPNE